MELLAGRDVAEVAARWIAERAERTRPFRIALAGGSSPKGAYERLARADLPWEAWHVWWSDERVVPPDHEDSNERMAREALLSRVSIPEEQVHPLRSTEIELPDRFDLVLLGIGSDGHCASLFPDHPALEARDPIVRVENPGLPPEHPRLTFTLPLINAARAAAFVVGGEAKREIVGRVLRGERSLPAARVQAEETWILGDDAVAP